MRILNSGSLAATHPADSECTVKDTPSGGTTWTVLGNVLVLGFIIAFWNKSVLAAASSVGVLVTFNIVMLVKRIGSVGYPVSVLTGSKLTLRFIADSGSIGPLKVSPSSPRFVELDADEIKGISGDEIEVTRPGSKKTRGLWVNLRLTKSASEALLEALRQLPQKPARLWLLAPGQADEFFLRWYETFTPTLPEWLAVLARSRYAVDVEVHRMPLDLTGFATMSDEEQKTAIRKLNALNLGPSALLMVKNVKKLSMEESDRFIKSAFE